MVLDVMKSGMGRLSMCTVNIPGHPANAVPGLSLAPILFHQEAYYILDPIRLQTLCLARKVDFQLSRPFQNERMQSRVIYGNVYGNCSNVRRRQVAIALTLGELCLACRSTRRTVPLRGDQAFRWASYSPAAAVKPAHQSIPYEQSPEEARLPQTVSRSAPPAEQTATPEIAKVSANRNKAPISRAIVASKFRPNIAPKSTTSTNFRAHEEGSRVPNTNHKQDVGGLAHTSAQLESSQHSSERPDRQAHLQPRTNRQRKRQRPAPNRIITAWQSGSVNFMSGQDVKAWSKTDALTSIFVRYITYMESPNIRELSEASPDQLESLLRPSEPFFTRGIRASLQKHGYTPDDVRGWAWIVLAPNAHVAVQRYLSVSATFPPVAILTNILRMKNMHIKTLRELVSRISSWLTEISNSPTSKNRSILEDNSFQTVVCGLLRHARATDPLSFTGIARLVSQYCDIVARISDESRGFGGKEYKRLTGICRTVICRLSIPAAKSPYASMSYAWEAQQVILEAGNSFQPALELDARSYRAIACVLLADKKTEAESEAVAHLHRSWPPWKKVLDGMDARRQPEDDTSRATRVLENMKAAGYPPTSFQNAISILAGRDTDGTPAIPTRTIMRLVRQKVPRENKHNKPLQPLHKRPFNPAGKTPSKAIQQSSPEPAVKDTVVSTDASTPTSDGNKSAGKSGTEWAARIRATRDVQEAWAAFRAYHGPPSQAMFHEMFLKLIYDRVNRLRARVHHPTPGDGFEVFPVENDNLSDFEIERKAPPDGADVENDNLSDFEIERKAPPDVRGLYDLMRAAQLTPGSRTLRHLVAQADSLGWALRLLLDSGLPSDSVSALVREKGRGWHDPFPDDAPSRTSEYLMQPETSLSRVPHDIFTAYIKLLARLSLATPSIDHLPPTTHLHAALGLLKKHPSPPDTAWHAFLRAAAAPKILKPPITTDPDDMPLRHYDHTVAPYWNAVVRESIAHLQHSGVEIDPDTFQYSAYALYSTIFAARRRGVGGAEKEIERAFAALRELWDAVSEPSEDVGGVGGELVHQVKGTHILSYIRVLAIADCDEEIEKVMEWMVRYQGALGVVGRTRGNGIASLRRVVVAARAYSERRDGERVYGEDDEGDEGMAERLSELAEQIEDGWGGWPREEEVNEYFREGAGRYGDGFGEQEWVVGGLEA
ncbi:hypothetical protein V495_01148 [Pseudogymnoascus sp. VKM F-4514 (FW-929)]|nr:hypothetical protein V495_01148 [Pseudogymnoascus sp. VKM F-4514 (FW-929)]